MKPHALLSSLPVCLFLLAVFPRPGLAVDAPRDSAARDIVSRWELFVDEFLIAQKSGVALKLHEPIRREIVLTTDQPWEGPTCAYFSALQDGGKVRLYYRGSHGGSDRSEDQVTCMVESTDGIHFTRPKLGLIEAGGTKDNNVIWRGVESHNFSPFIDASPGAKPDERYKALGGTKEPGKNWNQGETPGGLYAFASADGIHWKKMKDEPVFTKGAFDSQNLAFFDTTRDRYTCFSRIFANKVRAVQSNTSTDFLTWTVPVQHHYAEGVPLEHFYTSATVPCPTAPHLFVSFPKRFMPARKKIPEHELPGVSDAVFMSSRDGVNWDRPFLEAWVRPGPDPMNWTDRNNMTANGIIVTGDNEWSLYISEHYRHPDNRLRRITVRKQGFASMHADAKGGEFTTQPLKFTGKKLLLNYATSAAGSVQIEIQDESGKPVPKFTLGDMPELYGDEFEAAATWKSGVDLSALKGKTVRLRVQMKDADLYALRFAEWTAMRFSAAILLLGTSVLRAQESPSVKVLETTVISQQPRFYEGWPTMVRRSNGELMVVYSGGREFHVCPFGRMEMITSRDEGHTWTLPRVLADSAIDDRDSGIVETGKGTLLATMFNSFAYQLHMNHPERLLAPTFGRDTDAMLQRWHTMDAATTQEQKQAETGYWMLRSTDGGLNWSPRYRVSGYSPHGPVNLLDGRLFYATSNGKQAVAYVSEDDGLTWNPVSVMPVRAGELHAVQAADGSIIVQVRDKIATPKGTAQNTSQIISIDGGKTWSEKQKVADGYPSHLLRLKDGTLLMTYGRRVEPFGIRGKTSADHGRSWSSEFILTDYAATWDLGYPSSVELADGSLLTVWYEAPKDSHKAVLRQARWTLNR